MIHDGLSLCFVRPVMSGLSISMRIFTVIIIPNGVCLPVSMAAFPAMKTRQAVRVADQPDIARPQIIILAIDDTDVLHAIPDVNIRHHYYYWRNFHDGCRHPDVNADVSTGPVG